MGLSIELVVSQHAPVSADIRVHWQFLYLFAPYPSAQGVSLHVRLVHFPPCGAASIHPNVPGGQGDRSPELFRKF